LVYTLGVKLSHLAFFLLFVSLAAPAQTRKVSPKDLPPSAFKLIAVTVTGNHRYSSQEITELAGLKLGQTVNDGDFKAATQHLGDSGAFTDVGYSFKYESAGTRLTLQVTETDKLVPARFDNIVWFPDEELIHKLDERVPLFHGRLPLAGNLPDQVSEALQALMVERNVQGRIEYLRSGSENGPLDSIVYSISGLNIHIRDIEFAGAAPAEVAALQAAAKSMIGAEYHRITLRVQQDKNLLPVYLGRGYLKASFGDSQAKVIEETPKDTQVDVTFPVTPGLQYKLADIQISGAKVFPAERLRGMIRLQTSQPANALQLDEDLQAFKKLYGSKGYMAAAIHPVPEMDDAQATVKYQIDIAEGDVYKMGDLTIEGLDSRTTSRLQEDWKLRGGDPYDGNYLHQFLNDTAEELSGMGQWNITTHESLDEKDKMVDVTVRYDPKARP
jgi:outer membrane protein assembly factor BamA